MKKVLSFLLLVGSVHASVETMPSAPSAYNSYLSMHDAQAVMRFSPNNVRGWLRKGRVHSLMLSGQDYTEYSLLVAAMAQTQNLPLVIINQTSADLTADAVMADLKARLAAVAVPSLVYIDLVELLHSIHHTGNKKALEKAIITQLNKDLAAYPNASLIFSVDAKVKVKHTIRAKVRFPSRGYRKVLLQRAADRCVDLDGVSFDHNVQRWAQTTRNFPAQAVDTLMVRAAERAQARAHEGKPVVTRSDVRHAYKQVMNEYNIKELRAQHRKSVAKRVILGIVGFVGAVVVIEAIIVGGMCAAGCCHVNVN